MSPESLFVVCEGAVAAHRIHVLKWPKKNPDRHHPPLICVHGLTRMAYDFNYIADHLAQDRDVYAFSMAGRGESDWLTDASQYVYPNYVADCFHIIRDELKLTQIDWLGTSMGGLIGMWIAALDRRDPSAPPQSGVATGDKPDPSAPPQSGVATGPALIRRLVLNDIGPFLPLAAVQRIAFYAGKTATFNTIEDAERYCRAIYADFGIKDDAQWRFFTEKTVRPKQGGGLTMHYDPNIAKVFGDIKEDVSVWPIYEAVTCPTLLLRGVRSDVLSKEIAQDMTRRGPKAKLVTFENCGHAPALMDQEQLRVVAEFLQ